MHNNALLVIPHIKHVLIAYHWRHCREVELTKGDYFPEKDSKRPPGIAKNKACCIYALSDSSDTNILSNISLSYKLRSPLSSLRSFQKQFTPTPSPPMNVILCYVMKSEQKYLTGCIYTCHSLLS